MKILMLMVIVILKIIIDIRVIVDCFLIFWLELNVVFVFII